MREIEVKVRARNLQSVVERIEATGASVSAPVTQHDRVYGLPDEDGGGNNTAPWLRIRTEATAAGERTLFTLKRSVTNQLDSIEHETEVSDAEEMLAIVRQLGFVPYSDITKTRRTAHMDDGIELCIDSVQSLGDFVEAELLVDVDADYESVSATLWRALEQLGFTRDDEETRGYDVLVNELSS